MVIPEHIGCHRVKPHGFGHMQAVAPAFTRDSCKMHFTTDDLERLSVKQEFSLTYFESMRLGK